MTTLSPEIRETSPSWQWGGLQIATDSGTRRLPLAQIQVQARIATQVAEVSLEQRFENNLSTALEAVYIFPLPGGAAVSHFELRAGERTIVAQIQERGQARDNYQAALAKGQQAALLEQEREGVFTVSLGNLMPGESLSVKLVYSQVLPLSQLGLCELRLPTVVAPRYLPGEALEEAASGSGTALDTDRVPDASRISPPLLAPGFDPRIDFSLKVQILEKRLEGLSCSQHAIQMAMGSDGFEIELSREHERLNRDFVLRWRLAQSELQPQLLYSRWKEGYFGLLQLTGPARSWAGVPREVVFVVDRSGSMEGEKMVSAGQACTLLLEALGPEDRFAILAFDDRLDWFQPTTPAQGTYFLAADPAGQAAGQQFLSHLTARGGTELEKALKAALKALQHKDKSLKQRVVVLLTDGQIGDESAVLKRLQQNLGDCRVFAVGIDTAVNEALLNRLAALGGGSAHFVVPGEKLNDALRGVAQEMGDPVLTDLEIAAELEALTPERIPDLFVGRGISLCFRSSQPQPVTLMGKNAQGETEYFEVAPEERELDALRHLWARRRLTELEDRLRLQPGDGALRQEMISLSCEHGVLCRLTALIAVDQNTVSNPNGPLKTVVQPVEMPDLWPDEEVDYSCTGALPPPPPAAYPASAMPPGGAVPRSAMAAPQWQEPEMMAMDDDLSVSMPSPSPTPVPRPAPKAAKGFSPFKGLAGLGNPFAKKAAPPEKPAAAPPQPEAGLREAYTEFRSQCQTVCQALQAGQLPPTLELQRARTDLLTALAQSQHADRLPQLQRLLRRELLELQQGLQAPNIQVQLLLPLVEKIEAMLALVEQEWARLASETPARPFWERSI